MDPDKIYWHYPTIVQAYRTSVGADPTLDGAELDAGAAREAAKVIAVFAVSPQSAELGPDRQHVAFVAESLLQHSPSVRIATRNAIHISEALCGHPPRRLARERKTEARHRIRIGTHFLLEEIASSVAGKLDFQAHRDRLTGIRNLAGLEKDIERTVGSGLPANLRLVSIDMDGLKRINDRQGYAAGNAAIQKLATSLISSIPAGVEAYRIGGDEFVLLAKDVTITEVQRSLAHARAVGSPSFSWGDAALEAGQDWREAKSRAEAAMQRDKRSKKKRRLTFRSRKASSTTPMSLRRYRLRRLSRAEKEPCPLQMNPPR